MSRGKSYFILILLYLYIVAIPFYGFSWLNIGGRGVGRPDWLVGALLITTFCLYLIAYKVSIHSSPANKFMLLLLYTGILSAINLFDGTNEQFIDFGTKAVQLVLVTILFFVISNVPADEKAITNIYRTWIVVASLVSLHALYQILARSLDLPFAYIELTNQSFTLGPQSARNIQGFTQPSSVFVEPSFMVSFLAGPLIVSVVILLERKRIFFHSGLLSAILFGIMVLAIVFTVAQGIYISLACTFLVLYMTRLIKANAILRVVIATLTLVIVGNLLLDNLGINFARAWSYRMRYLILNIQDPLNTAQVTSFANRYQRILIALEIWMKRPILGVGLGNMEHYTSVAAWSNSPWVQLLVEQGVIGVLALALLFWSLIRGLLWRLKMEPESSTWRLLIISALALLILDIFDGVFTLNWTHPQRGFTLALANLVYIQSGKHQRLADENTDASSL